MTWFTNLIKKFLALFGVGTAVSVRLDAYNVGDTIGVGNELWRIKLRWQYEESDGSRWIEYELEDLSVASGRTSSLEVYEDDEWLVKHFDRKLEASEVPLTGLHYSTKWPKSVSFEGRIFEKFESGYIVVSKEGSPQRHKAAYADYRSGRLVLSFEVYEGDEEPDVWFGFTIDPDSVQLATE